MKKFEGWTTAELQYVASLIAGRDMVQFVIDYEKGLYEELVKEIRNRRVKEELFQKRLDVHRQIEEE